MTTARMHHEGLDGLRGIALLLVLGFHAGISGFSGGFLGVSLFFTLSGFLITGLLIDDVEDYGTPDLRRFWTRRVRRLLPASIVCLAVVGLLAPWVWPNLGQRLLFAFGYVANWGAVWKENDYANILAGVDPLAHFWSLAVEEQIYLLWPLLFWVGARRFGGGRRWMYGLCLAVICGAGISYALADGSWSRVYYGTDTRAAEVAVGGLLAVAIHRRQQILERLQGMVLPLSAVALGGLVLSATVSLDTSWVYQGGLVGVAVVSACAIVAAIVPGPVKTAMSHHWLRAIGRVSYGLYLWHWPMFVWIGTDTLQQLVGSVAASGALSYASYRLLEGPIRSGRVELRSLRIPAGIATAAILVCVAVTWPDPMSGRPRHYGTHVKFTGLEALSGLPADGPDDGRRPLRVVVLGDSVGQSATWGLAKSTYVANGSMQVVGLAIAGCPIVGDRYANSLNDKVGKWNEDCDPARWRSVVAQYKPDVAVVVYSIMNHAGLRIDGEWGVIGEPGTDAKIVKAMTDTVDYLKSNGVSAVLWADVPDIPDGRRLGEPARVARHNELIDEMLKLRPSVDELPLREWVASLSPDIRKLDRVHLSEEGSVRLAETYLGPTILSAGQSSTSN